MIYRVKFKQETTGGGKWSWSLWEQVDVAWRVRCYQPGFESKGDAKKDWREFAKGVQTAEVVVERE